MKYILNCLKKGGRCGVIVPEGVLYGSTNAHKELRRQLLETNSLNAVISLPSGVFQPYAGVKTSVLLFDKGGTTTKVMFLQIDNDGYRLDTNHDVAIEEDDFPEAMNDYQHLSDRWVEWQNHDQKSEWSKKWWFSDIEKIKANEYKLDASSYRPLTLSKTIHRSPLEIIDELNQVEDQIKAEIVLLKELIKKIS
jgi:type I restriction enzyme M protein